MTHTCTPWPTIGLALCLAAAAGCAPGSGGTGGGTSSTAPRFDAFGGLENLRFTATGFFRIEKTPSRTWIIDPAGHPFFSSGVNHVAFAGDTDRKTGKQPYHDHALAKYGSAAAWATATIHRFHDWDVNTAGAWSDTARFTGRLPYTVILNLALGSWHPGSVTDVFSLAWQHGVDVQIREKVIPHRDDPWLLGYFTDNELRWTRDWTSLKKALFDDYLAMPATAPGKQVLIQSLEGAYPDVAAFDAAWDVHLPSFAALDGMTALAPGKKADAARVLADKRRFLGLVADRYFGYTSAALHAADPNHLDLGCRFVGILVPKVVLAAAGRYVDVVSVNDYVFLSGLEKTAQDLFGPMVPPDDFLSAFEKIAGKPMLVSETGFRAAGAGLPNDYPPVFPVYPSQTARAIAWSRYLEQGLAKPYVVGIHWFEYEDEPKNGRFDGEDSNWGLVNVDDVPYEKVIHVFQQDYRAFWARVALGTSR